MLLWGKFITFYEGTISVERSAAIAYDLIAQKNIILELGMWNLDEDRSKTYLALVQNCLLLSQSHTSQRGYIRHNEFKRHAQHKYVSS